jgi:hypothetical protein
MYPGEAVSYKNSYGILDDAVRSKNDIRLSRAFEIIGSEVLGHEALIREVPIYTKPDRYGNSIKYPDPDALKDNFLLLANYIFEPAEVIGYQFGSLSCQSLDDPDQRRACEAGSLSNGHGPYGLGATSMRQRCADFKRPDTFYPMMQKIRLDLEKFKSIHEDD